MNAISQFDHYAENYDADLNQALSLTGEKKDYFAEARLDWSAKCLRNLGVEPVSAMDYGCGIGDTVALMRNIFSLRQVCGVDVSERSLDIARKRHSAEGSQFLRFEEYMPGSSIDFVYCNGVFHHIPLAERGASINYIYGSLRFGGLFAFWENNPWNPGTRYVMSRCSFDRDARTLAPHDAKRLLRAGGFEILRTDFLFLFPHFLKWFRRLEPRFSGLPLGAQYQVLCRKPVS